MTPRSPAELAEAIRSSPRVVLTGARSKPRLSHAPAAFTRISTLALDRLVEYEPDEFVVTVEAGMTLRQLDAILLRHHQHLPFDPLLRHRGATVGGTVAAGFNGPGRLRHGGIRDFILGVRFVDGTGRLLRAGGKVVKNAAGFDIPKFLVGSLGRFAALAEVTFKVFPKPAAFQTLELPAPPDPDSIARLLSSLARSRWEPDALELDPARERLLLRVGADPAALDPICADILAHHPGRLLEPDHARELWDSIDALDWAQWDNPLHPATDLQPILKVPLDLHRLPAFLHALPDLPDAHPWISAGGQLAWIRLPPRPDWDRVRHWLVSLDAPALLWRGDGPLHPGPPPQPDPATAIHASIRDAFDPHRRFPTD